MRKWATPLFFVQYFLFGCASGAELPKELPRSSVFNYMAELRSSETAAAAVAALPLEQRSQAFQSLAISQSFVGLTQKAESTAADAFGLPAPSEQAIKSAAVEVDELLGSYTPRDAIESIVVAARDRRIVILNEAHSMPRHRAFATRLALRLRDAGFQYFAAETLAPEVDLLAARGYPQTKDGYYSKEPVFGDLLRQVVKAGYVPIAYEHIALDDAPHLDMVARIELREIGQARNLIERVLDKDPKARLFIFVGYSHVEKGLQDINGKKVGWLAEQLRSMTGIDPLCISQVESGWQDGARDQALKRRVFADFPSDSFALTDKKSSGTFWNNGKVDIRVWHRPETQVEGRPHWLAMDGYREAVRVKSELLPVSGRRLVQAFVDGESADAVPMDQVIVTAGEPQPAFMLPKGKYRFAFQD
jgi:hypothetical protein